VEKADSASSQIDRGAAMAGSVALAHVLFPIGIVLSVLLFSYCPYRFVHWAVSLLAEGRGSAVAAAALLLAIVSFVGGCRWLAMFVLAYLAFRRRLARRPPRRQRFPFVSMLVPAYNESETIEPALASLLRTEYPHYEVLVVDDGSTDDTLTRARKFEGRHPRCTVRVFTKPNGGKWSAHNLAFQHARGELVLCLDADSRLAPDALRIMVQRIQEPGVDAVAGQVRVRNRINTVTTLQGLEYVVGNGSGRMAQAHTGTVLVVPGPIGLFSHKLLAEVCRWRERVDASPQEGTPAGPFESDTFAEDFDLSLTVLTMGGRIVYEPRAVSNTRGPDGLFGLINQRYRWCRGTIQVLRKYLRRTRRCPRIPRLVAWLSATYFYDLLLQPFLCVTGVVLMAGALAGGGDPLRLLGGMVPFLLLNTVAAAFFTAMHGDDFRILKYCPVYDLYHALLTSSVWVIAVSDELRGRRMRW